MVERVFKIQRPDGTFRGPGKKHRERVLGKVWVRVSDVRNHLKVGASYKDDIDTILRKAGAEQDEVVEYELREVSRVSTREFMEKREEGG